MGFIDTKKNIALNQPCCSFQISPGIDPQPFRRDNFMLRRLYCNNPSLRLKVIGCRMDLVHCALLWERQWVRWSGRQEIRWLCPPRGSLSPRRGSDAAAPLLSICSLPSHYLPLSSGVETCIRAQSDSTVGFALTVWLWKLHPWHMRLHAPRQEVSCQSRPPVLWTGQGPTLAPVSHPDELSLSLASSCGFRHHYGRHRRWQIANSVNTQFCFLKKKEDPGNIHPDSGQVSSASGFKYLTSRTSTVQVAMHYGLQWKSIKAKPSHNSSPVQHALFASPNGFGCPTFSRVRSVVYTSIIKAASSDYHQEKHRLIYVLWI